MTRTYSENGTPLQCAIGVCIRAERLAAEMSQADLAAAAGITRTAVANIEAGANTTVFRLARIAAALDCAIGDLLPPEEWPSDERYDGRRE